MLNQTVSMTELVLVSKLGLVRGTVIVPMVSEPIRIVLNPRVSMTGPALVLKLGLLAGTVTVPTVERIRTIVLLNRLLEESY